MLNEALAKLPDYQGVAVRRDKLPPAKLAEHQLGRVVKYPSFTSATAGDKDVVINEDSPHRLTIHSKHAKRIDWISKYPRENEVLFAAPTEFEVANIPKLNVDTGLLEIKLNEYR